MRRILCIHPLERINWYGTKQQSSVRFRSPLRQSFPISLCTTSFSSAAVVPKNFRNLQQPLVQQFIKNEKLRTTNYISQSAFAKWRLRIYNELEAYHRYQSIIPAVASSSSSSSKLKKTKGSTTTTSSNSTTGNGDNNHRNEYPIGAEQFGAYLYYCVAHEHHDFPVWYRQHKDAFHNIPIIINNPIPSHTTSSITTATTNTDEILVLDTSILAKYGKNQFANIGTLKPSLDPHQRYVAWTVDLDGSETYCLFIRDMLLSPSSSSSGDNLTSVVDHPSWIPSEIIPNAINFVWMPYSESSSSSSSTYRPGFFYTVANPVTKRAYRVYYHEMGNDYRNDKCLYEEKDESKFVDIAISKDQQLITIQINDRDTSEVHILYYSNTPFFPSPKLPLCVLSRDHGIQYFLEHQNGYLIMVTNAQGADNYKIMACDIRTYGQTSSDPPSLNRWHNLYLPNDDNDSSSAVGTATTRILDVDIFTHFIIIYERIRNLSRIKVLFTDTDQTLSLPSLSSLSSSVLRIKKECIVPLPLHTSGIDPGTNANTLTDTLRFTVYSSTAPECDYEYTLTTQKLRTLNQKMVGKVKGTPVYNPNDFLTYTINVPSYDLYERSFVKIPLTLVHHRQLGIMENEIQHQAMEIGKRWQEQTDIHDYVLNNRYTETWQKFQKKDNFCWNRIEAEQQLHSSNGSSFASTVSRKVQSMLFRNTSSFSLSSSSLPRPTLFHVYGAYGHDQETHFSTNRLPLLQRNWILAFAHVRGGKENGASWYYNGRGPKKLNSMFDTLACLHMLISLGITDAQSLACRTESAGSVIGGWLSNKYPTLVQTHIFRSPFLDVLTAMEDSSLPLTVPEYQEWGNPTIDPTIANFIRSYSPVQTVPEELMIDDNKRLLYPHLYIDASVTDTRVPVWHSLSFIEKLLSRIKKTVEGRSTPTGASAIVLPRIISQIHEQGSGHFGPGGRTARMHDRAKELTFLLSTVGRDKDRYQKEIF